MIDQGRPTKAVVTVTEMAQMVGLSRARFYQLMGTAFPLPVYDTRTRRPVFVQEQQDACLEVRRNHLGVDGKPVIFYARQRRAAISSPIRRKAPTQPTSPDTHDALVAAVRALGLAWATSEQVGAVMNQLFPSGVTGIDQGEVIRALFVKLKQQSR